MISILKDISANVLSLKASQLATKKDYDQIVTPVLNELRSKSDQLNFLLYFDSTVAHFTPDSWWEEALNELKSIGIWNRAAIITDSKSIIHSTYYFSKVMPGEFMGFSKEAYDDAIEWITNTSN